MIIHINEQMKTKFAGRPASEDPTILSNRRSTGVSTFASAAAAGFISDITSGTALSTSDFTREQIDLNFTRTIRRTTDTIALYMPDS
jgi:hypothetical protein